MVRALVGDSTMTSARLPPLRAGRLAAGAFAAGAAGAIFFGLGVGAATAALALDAGLDLAAAGFPLTRAFGFGAAAFDPFAFGAGEVGLLDFFGLLLAIRPDLDLSVSSMSTRKIVSN